MEPEKEAWGLVRELPKSECSEILKNHGCASSVACPLYFSEVAAGFPSPADDYIEGNLDLNEHLIRHPSATFFVRVSGDSMIGAGIHDNDILIVDRSLQAQDNKIIIAVVNGELTVKRLKYSGGRVMLLPENPVFPPICLEEGMSLDVWGVVTCVIHNV